MWPSVGSPTLVTHRSPTGVVVARGRHSRLGSCSGRPTARTTGEHRSAEEGEPADEPDACAFGGVSRLSGVARTSVRGGVRAATGDREPWQLCRARAHAGTFPGAVAHPRTYPNFFGDACGHATAVDT